jgi:hypothetical protein
MNNSTMTDYTTSTSLLLVILALSLWYLWKPEEDDEVVEVDSRVEGENGEEKVEEEDLEEVDTSGKTNTVDTPPGGGKDEEEEVDEEKGDDEEEKVGGEDEEEEVDEEKGDDEEEKGSESEAESEAESDEDLEIMEYAQKLPPDATGKRDRYRYPKSWFSKNDDHDREEDDTYSPTEEGDS